MEFLRVHLSNVELRRAQKASLTEGFHLSARRNAQLGQPQRRRSLPVTEARARVVPAALRPWPICGHVVESCPDGLSINGQIGSWLRTAPGTDASLRSATINFASTSPDYLALRGLPGPRLVHGFPVSTKESSVPGPTADLL